VVILKHASELVGNAEIASFSKLPNCCKLDRLNISNLDQW